MGRRLQKLALRGRSGGCCRLIHGWSRMSSRPCADREQQFVQAPYRFFGSRLIDHETYVALGSALADQANFKIGDSMQYLAGDFGATRNLLPHQANQRLVTLPSNFGKFSELLGDGRQIPSRTHHQRQTAVRGGKYFQAELVTLENVENLAQQIRAQAAGWLNVKHCNPGLCG